MYEASPGPMLEVGLTKEQPPDEKRVCFFRHRTRLPGIDSQIDYSALSTRYPGTSTQKPTSTSRPHPPQVWW